jgi:tetratricopeptide (TPR) repeat protein
VDKLAKERCPIAREVDIVAGDENDSRSKDPDARLLILLCRHSLHMDQGDFASFAGINASQLSDYEQGVRAAPRKVQERAVGAAGLPVFLCDGMLRDIRSFRVAARGRSRVDRIFSAGTAAQVIDLARLAADVVLGPPTPVRPTAEAPAAEDRATAAALWARLEKRSSAERRALVEELEEYWSWALSERIAAESLVQAPNHPDKALELAELACLIAEKVPGEELWRWRIQGHALLFKGNARRVCNDLPGSDLAFSLARLLFKAGAPGDSGLLSEAWLPALESSLRRDQRRFPEAQKLIEEALALDRGDLRGKILLSKSFLHETLGEPEASFSALYEAAPLIDPALEPRNAFGLRFNLVVALCALARFEEAEARLPEVEALAEGLGGELDLTRAVWLQARVHAGLGRPAQARDAFEHVRRVFERRGHAFNYALASLELALLLLKEGRAAEVSTLAAEMLAIFRSFEVERESLAALQLFCDASKRKTATVELAQRVVTFLHRAQHDPELRFEP